MILQRGHQSYQGVGLQSGTDLYCICRRRGKSYQKIFGIRIGEHRVYRGCESKCTGI